MHEFITFFCTMTFSYRSKKKCSAPQKNTDEKTSYASILYNTYCDKNVFLFLFIVFYLLCLDFSPVVGTLLYVVTCAETSHILNSASLVCAMIKVRKDRELQRLLLWFNSQGSAITAVCDSLQSISLLLTAQYIIYALSCNV